MNLKDVAAALGTPKTHADLVRVYVPGGSFGGGRPDVEIFERLHSHPAGQRIIVLGGSGAGKTSLILRVIGDIGKLGDSNLEPLILAVGDVSMIASTTAFLQSLLGTLASQEARFANVDPEALAAAAALETTTTGLQITHSAGFNAAVVSYQAELKEPIKTFKSATTATDLKSNLNDVISSIVKAGYRPLVVIDDTDRFARPAADGTLQADSIADLFTNGVQALCEIEPVIDVIVAVHPRYQDVPTYTAISARLGFEVLETPRLPVEDSTGPPPLETLLKRRLAQHGIAEGITAAFDLGALYALEAVYVERSESVREVLRVAEDACLVAHADGARQLTAQHVFAAQVRQPAT